MLKFFLSTFFLIGSLQGITQIVDNRVNKYVDQNSIDTFMIYSFPCSGGVSFDSCLYEEPNYLIWQKKGGFYLKRFDYCKTYKTLSLDTSNPLTFYLTNKRIIDKEKIHQPTYYEVKINKKKTYTVMVTQSINHSCYHKYQLPLTKKPKYAYANTYYLDFKTFDTGEKNIYYDYNQRTKLKGLIDLTTSLIEKFKKENIFQDE